MFARLKEKDLKQGLSSLDATTYVMLVFLKERKASNLFHLCNSNANRYSSTSTIQTLKQLSPANSLQKRKRKWQLKRETRRISDLDSVKYLVV
jgi:hypothetical protein